MTDLVSETVKAIDAEIKRLQALRATLAPLRKHQGRPPKVKAA